jgi:hypothetical protein
MCWSLHESGIEAQARACELHEWQILAFLTIESRAQKTSHVKSTVEGEDAAGSLGPLPKRVTNVVRVSTPFVVLYQ